MSNILNIIISPREALEALREKSDWLLPMLVAIGLLIIGNLLGRDASTHAAVGTMTHMLNTNSMFAGMGDAAKAKMLQTAAHPALASSILSIVLFAVVLVIGMILNSLFLLIGNAMGGGDANFKSLLSASALISIPSFGLIQVIMGVVEQIRGVDGFSTTRDILTVLPNLAMLAPNASGPLFYFLASIGIGGIWGLILNVTALRATADAKGPATWIIPTLILLLSAALASLGGIFS
ncbi:MAG: YIP1 family protein [Vulcanimicrobiaceae bacterium]